MVGYPKYATTVIGAYSVPDWYEALDRLVAVGQLSMGTMADVQFRAGEAAIQDQELANIDVITGGVIHRRTHNLHAPPNAMLNYFWQKILMFQASTRSKPITPRDPDVFHPAATCRDRIDEAVDLGPVDEFNMVSALTRKPVKITMTDPGKLPQHNFKLLAAAGCKNIQIDEPLFTMSGESEIDAAVQAINLAIEDLPADIHVSMYICQANYAVGKEYDAQIGHRYFDIGRYKADRICAIECSSYLIE